MEEEASMGKTVGEVMVEETVVTEEEMEAKLEAVDKGKEIKEVDDADGADEDTVGKKVKERTEVEGSKVY